MYSLREPQQKVYEKAQEFAKQGMKRILIMAATGFGKTILSHAICKGALSRGKKVLFTAHRITLAEQTFKKFSDLNPDYLQGNGTDFVQSSNLLVATLQTLLKTDVQTPDIIIIDEVHYGYKSEYINSIKSRFPNAIIIGLSATPVDESGYLLEGFDTIIDDYQMADLVELGWLLPLRNYAPTCIPADVLKDVKMSGADYQEKSLEQAVNKPDINNSVIDNYLLHGENKPFILFGSSQKHCEALKKICDDRGILTECITSKTTDKKRKTAFERYKSGEIKGLISIEILTTGFDEPKATVCIFANPTKAWRKFIQCAGRVVRLDGQTLDESIKNGKEYGILIDCCGNIAEHGLPTDRKKLKFGKKISMVIDREIGIDSDNELRNNIIISEEKQVYLKQIGTILDLYDGKVYNKEADLQEDVNSYLKKTSYFWWRQNSGKAFIKDRWVHFSSINGLPDNSVFFRMATLFFGLELKLKSGSLTDGQKKTLPEMTDNKILFFICESVLDVYYAFEHIEQNIEYEVDGLKIYNTIYDLSDRQLELRTRLKLKGYAKD